MDSDLRARLAGFGWMRIIDDDALEDQTKPSVAVERDDRIGDAGDYVRWSAPEMMNPDKFGFTKNRVAKLPSKSTDIYAFGMTILEVSVRFWCPWSSSPHGSTISAGAHRAPPIWSNHGSKHHQEGNRRSSSGETCHRVHRRVVEAGRAQLVGGVRESGVKTTIDRVDSGTAAEGFLVVLYCQGPFSYGRAETVAVQ